MQKARRHPFPLRGIGLRQLVSAWFQVLLTPLIRVLFIVQSPYSQTIGHGRVFRLGGWSPLLPTGFHVSGSTQEQAHALYVGFAYGTLTLFSQPFHAVLLPQALHFIACPTTPSAVSLQAVWPHPRSLATTWGISVDFSSSGY